MMLPQNCYFHLSPLSWVLVSAGLIAALRLTAPANAQDLAAGQKQFLTSCGVCHSADAGAPNRQGPNLHGICGRKAGSLGTYKYSDTLKKADWIWTEAMLDPWIENAQAAHPCTFMNYRQATPEKRQIVIDYLKSLSASN